MQYFFRNILLILLLPGSVWCHAQQPDDRISFDNINVRYLEHLVKEGIDSVRQAHELTALANDSILYVAAKDHALYLSENRRLSHYQRGRDKENKKRPQQRAAFYGAKNYRVGENVALTYLNKPFETEDEKETYINETYRQLANDLVKSWVKSPEHYKNMLTPGYEVTGLAIGLNPERNEVRAVQKFAEVKYKYKFEENKAFFDYSNWTPSEPVLSFEGISRERIKDKFAHGIRAPKDSLEFCDFCNDVIDTARYKNELELRGRSVIFRTPNVEMMMALIDNWRDGLAMEIVSYEPYDCENPEYYTQPSRRNNQRLLNGKVLKPLYKRHLKKGFKRTRYKWLWRMRKKDMPTHFEIKLGRLPRDLKGYVELNVLILQKNKLCRVMHLTDWCGKEFKELYEIPYLTKIKHYEFDAGAKYRTLNFTIPFEQGKANYDYSDIKPLIDSLNYDGFEILNASIKAYSSLEGSKELNLNLQERRAKSIIQAMSTRQEDAFDYTVKTEENWAVFEQQIEQEDDLEELRALSREEIRAKLKDRKYASRLEKHLKEQRKADISLDVKVQVTDDNLGSFLVGEFLRFQDSVKLQIKEYGYSRKAKAFVDTMANIQGFAYKKIKEGIVDTALFEQFTTPITPDYAVVIKDNLWYSLDLFGSKEDPNWEQQFYYKLNNLDARGISSFEIRYDVANYLVRNSDKIRRGTDFETLKGLAESLISQAKTDSIKTMCQHLLVNVQVLNAYNNCPRNRRGDTQTMRKSLEYLYDYYSNEPLNDSIIYKMAQFFTWCKQEDLAHKLLHPYAEKKDPLPGNLILFAKLNYYHIEEIHKPDYYEYLMAIRDKLSQSDWCSMFIGPCNISFQTMDYEPFRDFYCKECGAVKNHAESPEKWEKD